MTGVQRTIRLMQDQLKRTAECRPYSEIATLLEQTLDQATRADALYCDADQRQSLETHFLRRLRSELLERASTLLWVLSPWDDANSQELTRISTMLDRAERGEALHG